MTNYKISHSAFSAVFTWFIMSFFFFITSCTQESDIIIPETAYSNVMVEFNVSQKQEGSTRSQGNENSLNLDSEDYEDYVDMVRVMAFDHASGSLVFNELVNLSSGQTRVKFKLSLTSSSYDFYFLANESTDDFNLSATLASVTNRSDLFTLPALLSIPYNPYFHTGETEKNSDRFLMSARYEDLSIPVGGTENIPLLVSMPTASGKVELRRALAKVEIFLNNVVDASLSDEGKYTWTGPEGFGQVVSISTNNMAGTYSVFPTPQFFSYYQSLFSAQITASTVIYSLGSIPASKYIIDNQSAEASTPSSGNPWDLGNDDPGIGELVSEKSYRVVLYIPENLRELSFMNNKPQIIFNYTANNVLKSKAFDIYCDNVAECMKYSDESVSPATLSSNSVIRNNLYKLTATPKILNAN